MDLALNNLQRLICHKTNQTKPNKTATVRLLFTNLINHPSKMNKIWWALGEIKDELMSKLTKTYISSVRILNAL